MGNIRRAKQSDIEYISGVLSDYFEEINSHFGYSRYKTDYSIMSKNVEERILEDSSEFIYFVFEDDGGKLKGVANILLTDDLSEILLIKGEDIEIEEQLLNMVLDIFEREGKSIIYGDMYPWQNMYALLENRKVEILQSKYKLTV